MTVTITAKTASENAASQSAHLFFTQRALPGVSKTSMDTSLLLVLRKGEGDEGVALRVQSCQWPVLFWTSKPATGA
jgi:hypothetical protein